MELQSNHMKSLLIDWEKKRTIINFVRKHLLFLAHYGFNATRSKS
jgi:hypothetical protein